MSFLKGLTSSLPNPLKKEAMKAQMRIAFDFFDKDKSGFIEGAEIGNVLARFNNSPCPHKLSDGQTQGISEKLLGQIDKNADGKISYDEFCEGVFGVLKL